MSHDIFLEKVKTFRTMRDSWINSGNITFLDLSIRETVLFFFFSLFLLLLNMDFVFIALSLRLEALLFVFSR